MADFTPKKPDDLIAKFDIDRNMQYKGGCFGRHRRSMESLNVQKMQIKNPGAYLHQQKYVERFKQTQKLTLKIFENFDSVPSKTSRKLSKNI